MLSVGQQVGLSPSVCGALWVHRETEEGTFAPWRLFISDEEFCWQPSWFADGKTQECLGMVGVVRFLMGGAAYHARTLVLTPALTHAHTHIHACEYSQACDHASTHMHTHVDTHTACSSFKRAHINISILVSDSPRLLLPRGGTCHLPHLCLAFGFEKRSLFCLPFALTTKTAGPRISPLARSSCMALSRAVPVCS